MRYILIFFFFFGFLPVTLAEVSPYPDRLLNVEGNSVDLSRYEGLQNIYFSLYGDTNNEDNSKIFHRVKEHEKSPSQTLSQEINTYCDLGVPDVSYIENFSRKEQTQIAIYLQDLCDYERALLRFQNQLARKNWMRSMFANNRQDDSPFDVIADWNQVEMILFGEKWENEAPDVPTFASFDENTMQAFSSDGQDWQDQSKRGVYNGKTPSIDFGEEDFSLTGNLAKIKKPLQELVSRPLVGAIATTHFMQFGGEAVTSGSPSGMGVFANPVPIPDNTRSESKTVQEESLVGKFSGFVTGLLSTSECLDIAESGEQRARDDLEAFIQCGVLRGAVFENRVRQRETETESDTEKNHREKVILALRIWNEHLYSFLEQALEWHEVAKELLLKEKR